MTEKNSGSYDFTAIESKWQNVWEDQKTFATPDKSDKPKYYVLDMFPYPSGQGLHVGHPEGYTATDMKKAGFDAKRLHEACYSATEALSAGYTATQLYTAGYHSGELRKAGLSALALREAVPLTLH